MKEFRKNDRMFFICEECGKLCKNLKGLEIHIRIKHNDELYFNKWIKDTDDGNCKICNKPTEYNCFVYGYKNCCSKECSKKYTQIKTEEGCIKKYGVKNCSYSKIIKDKISKKNRDCSKTSSKKRIKTVKTRYGVNNIMNLESSKKKQKETMLFTYGVEYPQQNKEIQNKTKNTCVKKYGVEYPSQNIEVYNKGLKTRLFIHKYKDTNLTYQGTYELDFLDKFYNKIDIENGPSIKYNANGKNKVYHSDFYIKSLNLVVEIKSSWTLKLDIDIEEKKKAIISNGFN